MNNNLLNIPCYDAALFTVVRLDTGLGMLTEASTLGLRPGVLPGKRVYRDACDDGFHILNQQTGNKILFVARNITSEAWEYAPVVAETDPEALKTLRVIVYNA